MSLDSPASAHSPSSADPVTAESAIPSPVDIERVEKVAELRRVLAQSKSIHLLTGGGIEGMSLNVSHAIGLLRLG